MDNMGKEYRNILNNLEERLKYNPDLEYVKSEFTNLFMLFFDEIDSLRELYEEKIETILDRQSKFDEKINRIEEKTNELEKEMMFDDEDDEMIRSMLDPEVSIENEYDDDDDCEVSCPYCGEAFFIDLDTKQEEVSCPYCNRLIELDWNENSDTENDVNKKNDNDDDM